MHQRCLRISNRYINLSLPKVSRINCPSKQFIFEYSFRKVCGLWRKVFSKVMQTLSLYLSFLWTRFKFFIGCFLWYVFYGHCCIIFLLIRFSSLYFSMKLKLQSRGKKIIKSCVLIFIHIGAWNWSQIFEAHFLFVLLWRIDRNRDGSIDADELQLALKNGWCICFLYISSKYVVCGVFARLIF